MKPKTHKPALLSLILIVALLSFKCALAEEVVYQVQPSQSEVYYIAHTRVFMDVKGVYTQFSGSFVLEDGGLKSLNGSVKVKSGKTGVDKRDTHLLQKDFFYTEKYPSMSLSFNSGEAKAVKESLTAKLKIKDIEENIILSLERRKISATEYELTLKGSTSRATYNLGMSMGSFLIRDEIEVYVKLLGKIE